jgi:protease YdgD
VFFSAAILSRRKLLFQKQKSSLFQSFRRTMRKKFLTIFAISLTCVALLSTWKTVQAQSLPTAPAVSTIATAFDASTDSPGFRPSDRPQSSNPTDDTRAVIGRDDRNSVSPVMSRSYPWAAIGRLDAVDSRGNTVGFCTATLIGRDLAITNSHCVVEDGTTQRTRNRLVFKPSMIEGVALDEATVVSYEYGWDTAPEDYANDWAILKLDQPLGDIYGYLGWRNLDFTDQQVVDATKEKIMVVGYSGDFPTQRLREFGQEGETAGADIACSILGVFSNNTSVPGSLMHDCDTNPGASGSAIIAPFDDGNYYIIGLHSGSNQFSRAILSSDGVRSNVANRGVQVSYWARKAQQMQ